MPISEPVRERDQARHRDRGGARTRARRQHEPEHRRQHEAGEPVQADGLDQGQHREDRQRHQRQPAQAAALARRRPDQPQRDRRGQHVEHAQRIEQRRAPRQARVAVPVDQVEHHVGPAMLRVPRDLQQRCRQRADDHPGQSDQRAPRGAPDRMQEDRNRQHAGEVLRHQRARQRQAGQQEVERATGVARSQVQRHDQRAEQHQRDVGGDRNVPCVQRHQQQQRRTRPCQRVAVPAQHPPADRRHQRRRHQRGQAQHEAVARQRIERGQPPADHRRMVVEAPVGVAPPGQEVGLVAGKRQRGREPGAQRGEHDEHQQEAATRAWRIGERTLDDGNHWTGAKAGRDRKKNGAHRCAPRNGSVAACPPPRYRVAARVAAAFTAAAYRLAANANSMPRVASRSLWSLTNR